MINCCLQIFNYVEVYIITLPRGSKSNTGTQGLRFPLARSPEASETQLGRVKAICDLARLASGIIVVISVFNSLLNNVILFVYGMARAHGGVLVCVRYYTHTLSDT